jgi:hypothetical protein
MVLTGIDRQVAEFLLTGRLPGEMVMVKLLRL